MISLNAYKIPLWETILATEQNSLHHDLSFITIFNTVNNTYDNVQLQTWGRDVWTMKQQHSKTRHNLNAPLFLIVVSRVNNSKNLNILTEFIKL